MANKLNSYKSSSNKIHKFYENDSDAKNDYSDFSLDIGLRPQNNRLDYQVTQSPINTTTTQQTTIQDTNEPIKSTGTKNNSSFFDWLFGNEKKDTKYLDNSQQYANSNQKYLQDINIDDVRKEVEADYQKKPYLNKLNPLEDEVKRRYDYKVQKQQEALKNLEKSKNVPDEALGKASWEYYKDTHQDTNDFINGVGYILSTPYRTKIGNNLLSSANNAAAGEKGVDTLNPLNTYKKGTDNKIVDTVTSMGGNLIGLSATPANTTGQNLLNVGDNIAAKGANKLTSFLTDKGLTNPTAQRLLTNVTRGAIDGGIGGVADDLRFTGGENPLKSGSQSALYGGLFGGVLGEGSNLVGKAKNKFTTNFMGLGDEYLPGVTDTDYSTKYNQTEYTNTLENPLVNNNKLSTTTDTDIKNPLDQNINWNRYKNNLTNPSVRSTEARRTTNRLNNAIKKIQAYTGKTNLTDDEMLKAMDDLNINIFDYIDDLENAEKILPDFEAMAKKQDLGQVAGVNNRTTKNFTMLEPTENSSALKKVTEPVNNVDNITNANDINISNSNNTNTNSLNPQNNKTEYMGLEMKEPTTKKKSSIALDQNSQPKLEEEITFNYEGDNPIGEGQELSKMKWNTYNEAPFMQSKEVQNVVDEVEGIYNIKTNKESYSNAVEMLNNDFEGTMNRIRDNGLRSSEDSVASALITNRLIKEAENSGDYSQVREWLNITRSNATDLGQTLQAISTWKKLSPEGTLMNAQKIMDSSYDSLTPKQKTSYQEEVRKAIGSDVPTTPEQKNLVSEIKKKYGIVNFTDEELSSLVKQAEKVEAMPEGREKDVLEGFIKKQLIEKIPSSTPDKIKAIQRINLLMNLKTIGSRNLLGNVGMNFLEELKDLPGTLIDKAISKKTGQRTTKLSPGLWATDIKGKWTGLKNTIDDARKGIDTSRSTGKYELSGQKAFTGEGFTNNDLIKKITKPIDKVLSKAEDITSFGLKLGDTPFFEGAYNRRIKELQNINKSTEITNAMKEDALNFALERTYQNDSTTSKLFQKGQKLLNIGNSEFGPGNIVIPFTKTPGNIVDKSIDYSPIGGFRGIYNLVKNLESGKVSQKYVVDQLSRGLTGTSLMFLGMLLNRNGVLTSNAPKDTETAALQKQAGILPYALKSGNTYYTLDWFQPAAMPLLIGADIEENKGENLSTLETFLSGAKTGFSTVFNQSALTGLSNLFGGYNQTGGENLVEGIQNTGLSALEQFVPFNSALKQVNDIMNKESKETYDSDSFAKTLNKIKSKIPGLSNELPDKIDTEGNVTQKYNNNTLDNGSTWSNIKYGLNALINPGQVASYNPNTTEKTALDLYESTGDTSQMPRYADKTINYKTPDGTKQSLQLNAEEKSELQKIMGKYTTKFYNGLSSDSNYKKMSEVDKIKYIQKNLTKIEAQAKEDFLKSKNIKTYQKKTSNK